MKTPVRKRSRARPAVIEAPDSSGKATGSGTNGKPPTTAKQGDASDRAPNIVRLKLVLSMVAEGKAQKEIAAHIGRDPRTVRRMLQQAKDLGLGVSEHLMPEDAVVQVIRNFAGLQADLIDMKREAEAEGNFKHRIWCVRELCRLEMAYAATLQRIGFFDSYRIGPPAASDPGVEGIELLLESARNLAAVVPGPVLEGEAEEVEDGKPD